MTDFLTCISTATETGKLSAKQEAEAREVYDQAREEAIAKGLAPDAADTAASMETLKNITEYKRNQRWELLNEISKQHANYTEIMAAKGLKNVLASRQFTANMNSIMDRVDRTHDEVSKLIFSKMAAVVEQFSSKGFGLIKPLENMENIVRFLFGDVVEPAAKILGEQTRDAYEFMRNLTNAEGAHITFDKTFRLNQKQDRFLVRDAGKETWVNDHLNDGVLDWEEMRYHGKKIKEEDRAQILGDTWDAITSEGRDDLLPGAPDGLSLASRVSRERFLKFATADGWINMNRKYGKGNVYEQLMGHVESTARNVALMRHLGPNPDNGARFVMQTLQKRTNELGQGLDGKAFEKLRTEEGRELKAFQDQYDIAAHKVDYGEGDAVVQLFGSARTFAGAGLLGNVGIMSLSDIAYGSAFRSFYKMPFIAVLPKYLDAALNMKNFKREMLDGAIGLESALRMLHDSNRYTLGMEGSHYANLAAEFNFRASGAATITNIGHGIAGMDFARGLARFRELSLDQVPFVELLRNLGITDRDWNLVRDTPLHEPDYYNFGKAQLLRPVDMIQHAGSDEARIAAQKFMLVQEAMLRGSVPSGNIGARALLGGNISPRSLPGQFMKTSAQFMLFPAGVMYGHWKMALGAPTLGGKLTRFGKLVAWTTVAGAMLQQLKALAAGQGIIDMDPETNPKFWMKSLVVGGAGSILGDFLWNNISAAKGGISNTPLASFAGTLGKAPVELAKWAYGDSDAHPGAAVGNAAWAILPKPAPMKLIIERTIMDAVLQESDPAAYARKLKAAREREQSQITKDWWPMEGQ